MTRSVVAASATDPGNPRAPRPIRLANTRLAANKRLANKGPANKRPAHEPIKAIPGQNPVLINRLPFLSCRCAVIVGADNILSRGTPAQPRALLVGVRLRPGPGFQYPDVHSSLSFHALQP